MHIIRSNKRAMAARITKPQLQLAAAAEEKKEQPTTTIRCSAVPRRHDADDELQALSTMMGRRRWHSSVASGLRAALACTIVGLVSLYAPPGLRRHITFPAFSYVVTVIIVTDATLGSALRGAVSALHASLMGAAPSVVALWLAHRTGAAESVLATSAVVVLTTFAVTLPESAGPVAKRIALGQIIIIYVAMFRRGEHPGLGFALGHPANVVACTALGVAAALLAVVVPWPRLATREARDKSREYRALAAERVRVMVDAAAASMDYQASSSACRRWQMAARMSEAKRLASAGAALLHSIVGMQEDSRWEQAGADADSGGGGRGAINSSIEMSLTGMQMTLAIMVQGDNKQDDEEDADDHNNMRRLVMAMRDQTRLALLTPSSSTAVMAAMMPPHQHGHGFLTLFRQQQLAPFLFLFCLYQLHPASSISNNAASKTAAAAGQQPAVTEDEQEEEEEEEPLEQLQEAADGDESVRGEDKMIKGDYKQQQQEEKEANNNHNEEKKVLLLAALFSWFRRPQLVAAAKCGFSLGLAVLLGLLLSNDHGFWSGLIVATTITAGRESTWGMAAARAHGTALGSVYAALGCLLIPQRRMELRFLALLPWMVAATSLKRSRAYGAAGGVAAAVSAVIIMGRRYDEAPMAFTVARLVETFIGIACAVLGDLLFQRGLGPRPREQLARLLHQLMSNNSRVVQVQQQLMLLRKQAGEAASEPAFLWLPPFPAACYADIQGSLARMAQLLHLYHQARAALTHLTLTLGSSLQLDHLDADHHHRRFSSLVSASLDHCRRIILEEHHHQAEEANTSNNIKDLEAGNNGDRCKQSRDEEEAPEEVAGSFLAHARAALLPKEDSESETGFFMACCVASIALCMGETIKEARRLEDHIIDLNNLTSRIDHPLMYTRVI